MYLGWYFGGVKQMILVYNEKFTVQGTGVLACKWRNCGREFTEKKYLVDHVTSSHIEQRKGCDDFPCFWEVISLFLVNIVKLSLTLTLIVIKPPTILSVFFFKSRLNMRCDAQWLWCRHVLVGWNRSMRSTSCSPTCEFTLERSRTSAGWVSFGVGVSLLYRQQVTVLCMKIVKWVQRCCPPCRTVHWNLTPGFLL